jgi:hypothetical protein
MQIRSKTILFTEIFPVHVILQQTTATLSMMFRELYFTDPQLLK